MRLPPARKRGQALAEHFGQHPNDVLHDWEIERRFGAFNNARKDYERWTAHFLPGVTRNVNGNWSYKPVRLGQARPAPAKARRGQAGTCVGKLTIVLSGPKGCGKSMVKKILDPLLPLLPLDEFEIVKE